MHSLTDLASLLIPVVQAQVTGKPQDKAGRNNARESIQLRRRTISPEAAAIAAASEA
jgi:hypothetical protein